MSLDEEAAKYISEEKTVKTVEEALKGASDILAEEVSEKAELRVPARLPDESRVFISRIKDDYPQGSTKFEMYRDFKVRVKDIAPHNMHCLGRD